MQHDKNVFVVRADHNGISTLELNRPRQFNALSDELLSNPQQHLDDIATVNPDSYMRIRDRVKDVIISGGENIASLEVDEVILRHPVISSVAVVAMKDDKWGCSTSRFCRTTT